MVFNFKNYYEDCSFEIKVDDNIDITQYKFIRFVSLQAQKAVFNFYKEEMQQGNKITTLNLGYSFIKGTGFFDVYPSNSSWATFKKHFNSIVLYTFEMSEDAIWLSPIHINQNNEIYTTHANEILVL